MEVEKLSLAELLGRCKVGQLWGLVVILAGLIVGAFTIGYKLSETVNQANVSANKLDITQLEHTLANEKQKVSALETERDLLGHKDMFLSLYLRYQLAKERKTEHPDSDVAREEFRKTAEAFDNYLKALLEQQQLGIETKVTEPSRFSKGGGGITSVKFPGTPEWQIPSEFSASAEH